MEKQKPGFGRAFVVLGSCISRVPASGRYYPWLHMSEGGGALFSEKGSDPGFLWRATPCCSRGCADRRGDKVGCVTQQKRKKPDLSIRLFSFLFGCPGWIRTTECLSQSQVPYRLATGQNVQLFSHFSH